MFHSRSRHQIAGGHSTTRIPHSTTRIPHAATRIQHSTTRVPHAAARIPHPAASVPHATARNWHATTRVPHATTRIPHPAARVPHATAWTDSRWSRLLIFVVCTTLDRTCGFGSSSNGTLHTERLTRFRLQHKHSKRIRIRNVLSGLQHFCVWFSLILIKCRLEISDYPIHCSIEWITGGYWFDYDLKTRIWSKQSYTKQQVGFFYYMWCEM